VDGVAMKIAGVFDGNVNHFSIWASTALKQ